MSDAKYLDLLRGVGAIITSDHLVYTSGRHGEVYVNKDALYPHVSRTVEFCEGMANLFASGIIDVVAGPAMGGIILSQHIAFHLSISAGREVLAVYAEKDESRPKEFRFGRGYADIVRGSRVLVVEDVLTTGESARRVVDLVRETGGTVIGVAALCNRGDVKAEQIGVQELKSLVNIAFTSWSEDECPLCRDGVPINTKVGKGRDYLAKQSLAND